MLALEDAAEGVGLAAAEDEDTVQHAAAIREHLEAWGGPGEAMQQDVPRAGTAAWFRFHRHSPINSGHDLTIFQAAYTFLRLKRMGKMTMASFDALLSSLCNGFVPGTNFPRYRSFDLRLMPHTPHATTLR